MHPWAGRTDSGDAIVYTSTVGMDAKKFSEHRQYPIEEDTKVFLLTCEWWMWQLDVLSRSEGRMVFVMKVIDEKEVSKDLIFCKVFRDYLTHLVAQCAHNYCEHDSMFVAFNAPFVFRM